jgi:hypothetical protein
MRSLDVICMWFVEFEQKPGTSYHHRGHPAQSNISAGHYFPALVAHTFSVCLPPSGTSNGPGNGFFHFASWLPAIGARPSAG